ncbi:hypothetical protein [Thioclava kandeliae]|uniref:Uncharacterized protein n=1 Tax=Thioclava kandeliae TaxID=3070818 RepID=A0ABV1SGD6_9RHOB
MPLNLLSALMYAHKANDQELYDALLDAAIECNRKTGRFLDDGELNQLRQTLNQPILRGRKIRR